MTPQCREEFSRLTGTDQGIQQILLLPIAPNQTRWNSDFLAVKRAIQLQNAFEVFSARHIRDGFGQDQSDIED